MSADTPVLLAAISDEEWVEAARSVLAVGPDGEVEASAAWYAQKAKNIAVAAVSARLAADQPETDELRRRASAGDGYAAIDYLFKENRRYSDEIDVLREQLAERS